MLVMLVKLEFRGDISGFEAINAKIYTENMNEELYYDVLHNEVKQFVRKTPAQGKMVFQQGLAP